MPTGKDSVPSYRATLNEVLYTEVSVLRPTLLAQLVPSTFTANEATRIDNLKEIYAAIGAPTAETEQRAANQLPLTALCLSGGGIRSATFNLGALQGLAKIGLLGRFDYLSSVSGGGYIAGWLGAWMRREGVNTVVRKLGDSGRPNNPLAPEPAPVAALREYSNYLTPEVGLFSGDTWAAAAIILRNLILNWLVLIPLLSAVIGLPLVFLLFVRSAVFPGSWHHNILTAALMVELVASLLVYSFRRFAKSPGMPQAYFIFLCALPICLAAGILATAALGPPLPWQNLATKPSLAEILEIWKFAAIWCVVVPIIGWLMAEALARWLLPSRPTEANADTDAPSHSSRRANTRQVAAGYELIALVISGASGMAMLVALTVLWFPCLYNHPALYVMLVPPLLLGIYLISRVLFVGIASLSDNAQRLPSAAPNDDDADREWWARLSGWVLLVAVSWIAVTGICLLGSYIPEALSALFPKKSAAGWVSILKWLVGAVGGVSGLIAALTGSSASTPAGGNAPKVPASRVTKLILAFAGPLFIVCLIILLSWGVKALGEVVLSNSTLFEFSADWNRDSTLLPSTVWAKFSAILLSLGIVAIAAGRIVNVNRFSLHGMYRNRLVRAYLGASNTLGIAGRDRKPDPFTGFALDDNLPLHDLWPQAQKPPAVPGTPVAAGVSPRPTPAEHLSTTSASTTVRSDAFETTKIYDATRMATAVQPLSIINTTLNLVHGENLAWQQRKAESFSMTPFFCGNLREGYRRSSEYGTPGGITLGTAITISGAAANPNMGYCSSPALSFVMAIFNVRLGAWLGNTNERGNGTYRRPGPRQAIMPLFAEMFGLTNASRKYVNLSDGGHFDNLGLYEVVLRRCRRMLVSDAGQDGSFAFEDLGNAIRKIRIDFGINIIFKTKIEIRPRGPEKKGLYCAVASVRYSEVDGTDPNNDGVLIYIKPTLLGRGEPVPYDIYSYAQSNEAFPHESTADQWFSESQFESYRALGFHIVEQLGSSLTSANFEEFNANVKKYIDGDGRMTGTSPT